MCVSSYRANCRIFSLLLFLFLRLFLFTFILLLSPGSCRLRFYAVRAPPLRNSVRSNATSGGRFNLSLATCPWSVCSSVRRRPCVRVGLLDEYEMLGWRETPWGNRPKLMRLYFLPVFICSLSLFLSLSLSLPRSLSLDLFAPVCFYGLVIPSNSAFVGSSIRCTSKNVWRSSVLFGEYGFSWMLKKIACVQKACTNTICELIEN